MTLTPSFAEFLAGGLPQPISTVLLLMLIGWVWRIDRKLAVLIAELRSRRVHVTGEAD